MAYYAALQQDANTDRFVELDPSNGAVLQSIGPIGFTPVFGMAIARDDTFYASALAANDKGRLLTIDMATGTGTEVPTTIT